MTEQKAHVGSPADATRDADAVLLAVHWTRVDDVLSQAGALSGKVLLSCSLPMSHLSPQPQIEKQSWPQVSSI